MMIDPPIDKLIKKSECRYALVCAVSKRTYEIMAQQTDSAELSGEKAVSQAIREIYDDKYIVVRE